MKEAGARAFLEAVEGGTRVDIVISTSKLNGKVTLRAGRFCTLPSLLPQHRLPTGKTPDSMTILTARRPLSEGGRVARAFSPHLLQVATNHQRRPLSLKSLRHMLHWKATRSWARTLNRLHSSQISMEAETIFLIQTLIRSRTARAELSTPPHGQPKVTVVFMRS